MTIRQILENLYEENGEIVNYRPEDYDKYIEYFIRAKENLQNLIDRGKDFTHYNDEIIKRFYKLKDTLIKSFTLKERAHQNTSLIKEKYKTLVKAIFEYNSLLNDYKKKTGKDLPTIGDAFIFFGQNKQRKGSVNTEEEIWEKY